MSVVIPSVKDCVESFGLGDILERMVTYKYLLGILKLVGQHIKRDLSALFTDKCIYVECAVAVYPVLAKTTKVVARSVKLFLKGLYLYVSVLRHIKSNRGGNDGRSKRGSLFYSVLTAHKCGKRASGCYEIGVFAVV